MMLPLALFIFGLGGPIKSIKCTEHPATAYSIATQTCVVKLRKPAALGDRITLVHSARNPTSSAETMWEFGRGGIEANTVDVVLHESPETEVVGVRYDGRGTTKSVSTKK